ncbi:MAG: aspartate/glutamate racemase family protein [Alphaproteobacteria bacterium]
MPVYKVRPKAEAYGYSVGILLLEYRGPFVPGDVGNATTYDYPVLYKTVPGATTQRVFAADPELEPAVIKAAQELEAQGVKAISSDCGFFMNYQDLVARSVSIPVAMSSLLQIPFVSSFLGSKRPVGVITASARALGNRVLELAGVDNSMNVVVRGMEDEPHFKKAILDEDSDLDTDRITTETIAVAKRMVKDNPDMGAIILECSMLPPYSKAVQDATGLPVYDFINMIDYVQRGTHSRSYEGRYY